MGSSFGVNTIFNKRLIFVIKVILIPGNTTTQVVIEFHPRKLPFCRAPYIYVWLISDVLLVNAESEATISH